MHRLIHNEGVLKCKKKNKEHKVVWNKKYYSYQLPEFHCVHAHEHYNCFLMCTGFYIMKECSNLKSQEDKVVHNKKYYSDKLL